jgi:hypothetical protein
VLNKIGNLMITLLLEVMILREENHSLNSTIDRPLSGLQQHHIGDLKSRIQIQDNTTSISRNLVPMSKVLPLEKNTIGNQMKTHQLAVMILIQDTTKLLSIIDLS